MGGLHVQLIGDCGITVNWGLPPRHAAPRELALQHEAQVRFLQVQFLVKPDDQRGLMTAMTAMTQTFHRKTDDSL